MRPNLLSFVAGPNFDDGYGSDGPEVETSKVQSYWIADFPFSSSFKTQFLQQWLQAVASTLPASMEGLSISRSFFAPHSPILFHQHSLIAHHPSCEADFN